MEEAYRAWAEVLWADVENLGVVYKDPLGFLHSGVCINLRKYPVHTKIQAWDDLKNVNVCTVCSQGRLFNLIFLLQLLEEVRSSVLFTKDSLAVEERVARTLYLLIGVRPYALKSTRLHNARLVQESTRVLQKAMSAYLLSKTQVDASEEDYHILHYTIATGLSYETSEGTRTLTGNVLARSVLYDNWDTLILKAPKSAAGLLGVSGEKKYPGLSCK